MIVTCPQCSAKYRVRDQSVPVGGAELQCPECTARFIAHPPKTEDLHRVIDKLTDAKTTLEARLGEKAEQLDAAQQRVQETTEQIEQLRHEQARLNAANQEEVGRLRAEVASKTNELGHLSVEISKLHTAVEEGAQYREQLHEAQEQVTKLRDELSSSVGASDALKVAKQRIVELEHESQTAQNDKQQIADLQTEISSLKAQLSASSSVPDAPPAGIPPEIASMVAAMGPMLWGLDKAIEYIEPFSGNEEALAGHVRQLKTLAAIIKRLTTETQS